MSKKLWLSILFCLLIFSPGVVFAAEEQNDTQTETAQAESQADSQTDTQESNQDTAEEPKPKPANLNSDELEQSQQLNATRVRLATLLSDEQLKQMLVVQLRNDLENVEVEDDREQINQQIKMLEQEIKEIRKDFERTLTGGIDQTKLIADAESSYNWRTDLEEIMKPIFRSMKDVTEKPREIERLRSKVNFLRRNIELSESALQFIEQISKSGQLPDTFKSRIETTRSEWATRYESLNQELEIVQLQLQTRMEENTNFINNFGSTLSEFAKGRGLNIILALLSFLMVYVLFNFLRKGYRYLTRNQKHELTTGLTGRLLDYSYQIIAVLFATTALLLVFYVQGDWIMLGISLLIIAAIFFSIKNYFFKFVVETKLLLNIGPVREGERMQYQGIPFKVDSIGVYTELFNPLLTGGRVRVQLREIVELNSRPFHESEAWFPCREGDMLLMPNGRLVKVELQTPEIVKLAYTGGATTTVLTPDFLGMSFTNLSEASFRVSTYFGVDYELQPKSTSRVPAIFRDEIQDFIESQNYGKYLKVLRVELHEAASSSITYKVLADFHGIAARHHNIIKRALQSACVDVCNRHGWSIPFNQLTIHQSTDILEDQDDSK